MTIRREMKEEESVSEAWLKNREEECKQNNHKGFLKDVGYAGPESGSIELECSNCGWSYSEVLY